MRSDVDRRLDHGRRSRTSGTSATRRTSRWPAGSAGTARTSSCPTRTPRWPGRSASSRSTTARTVWLNGKPIGENTGAYIPFEFDSEQRQAPRDEPAGGARGLQPPDHRLPARGPEHATASRPAAGGTTPASSARSTSEARHGRLPEGPGPPGASTAAPARRGVQVNDQPQERHPQRPAGDASPASSATTSSTSARRRSAPDGIASFSDTLRIAKPRLWSPADPHLYDVSFTVRVGGKKVAGYSLHSGIRSIKVSGGRLILNGQFLNIARARPARGLQGAGLRDRQRPPRPAGRRGQGARRDGRCARTTRCIPTRTSWPTGSGC